MKLTPLLVLFLPMHLFSQDTIVDKKIFSEVLIEKYCKELNDIVLQPNIPYDFYCPSNKATDLVDELPSIVHEEYHGLNIKMNLVFDSSKYFRKYYFDGKSYQIKKTPTFESSNISQIVPKIIRDSIFRFKTYISGDNEAVKNPDSKVDGIYGIFEEYAAYCTGFKVYVKSYSYLKSIYPFDSTNIWIHYLTGAASSEIYSYYEFQLFIFWYVQLAKMNYPKIYAEIDSNISLKFFKNLIDKEFNSLISEYWKNRTEIDKNISPKVIIRDNYIYKRGNLNSGFGLPDAQLLFTKKLYEKDINY